MADPLDFSQFGAVPYQEQSPAAQATPARTVAAQPSDPSAPADFGAMGAHPVSGPTGDWTVDWPRRAGTALVDAAAGAVSLPYTAASALDWLGNKAGVNLGAADALHSTGIPLAMTPEEARQAAFAATGGTEYVPQTEAGRMVQAGLAAVPMALTQGPRALVPTVAGTAVGQYAADAVPGHANLAQLAGFMAGAHGASLGANFATRAVGAATGTAPTTPLFQAYQRQGVPTTLSGDVTQQPGLQLAQSMAAKMPGGSHAVGEAIGQAVLAWQDAAERSAASLGPAATMQDAGVGLQQAAQQWLQDWRTNSAANWTAFRQAVPGTTPISVSNFQQAINDVNQNFGGAQGLAQVLQPGLSQQLREALNNDISPAGTLPWQSVQATRTRLGEMMETGQPVADMAQSAIRRLYGALSDDMRNGANQAGPQAARTFNQANAYTAFGHDLLEDHLNSILNATNPEQAAQYALAQARQGGSRLAMLNTNLPGQTQNLGAVMLRQAAAPDAGPSALLARLRSLSPEAQQELFNTPTNPAQAAPGGMTQAGQGVADLSAIARAMRDTVRRTGNNSNTAAHEASGLGRVMSAIEMSKQGAEVGGGLGRVVGAATGLFAPNLIGGAARLMGANPLLSRLYSTEAAPLVAPSVRLNALSQVGMQDQRNLAPNALLPSP